MREWAGADDKWPDWGSKVSGIPREVELVESFGNLDVRWPEEGIIKVPLDSNELGRNNLSKVQRLTTLSSSQHLALCLVFLSGLGNAVLSHPGDPSTRSTFKPNWFLDYFRYFDVITEISSRSREIMNLSCESELDRTRQPHRDTPRSRHIGDTWATITLRTFSTLISCP